MLFEIQAPQHLVGYREERAARTLGPRSPVKCSAHSKIICCKGETKFTREQLMGNYLFASTPFPLQAIEDVRGTAVLFSLPKKSPFMQF